MALQALSWWVDGRPSWLAALVGMGAKATLVLGAAGVMAIVLRRRPAEARHLLWCLAMMGILALPPLAALVPPWHVPLLPQATAPRDEPPPTGNSAVASTPELPSASLGPPQLARPSTRFSSGNGFAWDERLLWVWLTGTIAVLGRLLIARMKVCFFAQRSTRVLDWRQQVLRELVFARGVYRPVNLLESAEVGLPMTWGILRPVIAIPVESRAWSRVRLESALAHEVAHVRRLDALTQLIAQVACAVYWFHPLAWFAAFQARILREFACDDEVLAHGTRPSQYAHDVLEIVRAVQDKAGLAAVAVGMAKPSQLSARMFAVLNPRLKRARVRGAQVFALTGLMSGLVLALAMIRPIAAAAAPAPTAPVLEWATFTFPPPPSVIAIGPPEHPATVENSPTPARPLPKRSGSCSRMRRRAAAPAVTPQDKAAP